MAGRRLLGRHWAIASNSTRLRWRAAKIAEGIRWKSAFANLPDFKMAVRWRAPDWSLTATLMIRLFDRNATDNLPKLFIFRSKLGGHVYEDADKLMGP